MAMLAAVTSTTIILKTGVGSVSIPHTLHTLTITPIFNIPLDKVAITISTNVILNIGCMSVRGSQHRAASLTRFVLSCRSDAFCN